MATTTIAPNAYLQSGSSPPTAAQRLMAQTDIGTAWESHKKNGLAFGRACYEWRTKFSAQGTHGDFSFSGILKGLDIPRHIADYWADKYKAGIGEGIPCEHCTETFPSKTQLRKHVHVKHLPTIKVAPPMNTPTMEPAAPALPSDSVPDVEELTTLLAPLESEPEPASEPIEAPAMKILPPEPKESDTTRLRQLFKDTGIEVKQSVHGNKFVLDGLSFAQCREIATMLVSE
jgi:hypothetical protein